MDHPSDWTSKVAWMRDAKATRAEWSESGKLLSVELGPVYDSVDSDDETQQKTALSPQEQAAKLTQERRHLSLAATGSLVRREPR